jgi:Uma2 family endonuclease
MSTAALYDEMITLPRAVRFPVELLPPDGFDPDRLETWPRLDGRLEYVEGRLLFMPPCGELQQDTATDVTITLGAWTRSRSGFVLGTNEAGMRLLGATRAADAAIWRRADLGRQTSGLRRVPPVLAVEIAGDAEGDTEALLREKAAWYLAAGVAVVWIVLPGTREVLVSVAGGEQRLGAADPVPEHPELPGLTPLVAELFHQLDAE